MGSMPNTDRKNLLLIVPTLRLGGQERVAVNTAEILNETYNVTMVIFDSREAIYLPNCELIELQLPAKSGAFNKAKNVFHRVVALKKLKKEREIDVSLSFGKTANLANTLSKTQGKTISAVHAYAGVTQGVLNRIIYRFSDCVVGCSKKICSDIIQCFPEYENKVECVENPYDQKTIWAQGNETVEDFTFGAHVVVAHGRLNEVKNHQRLIKSFSLVVQEISDAQLLVIGEGEMRPELEELIRRYNVEKNVSLLGFRKNPFAYLEKSTVYALTSYSEGFPNALVEAMFFLPVISVDCKSGPREILSDGVIDQVCDGIEEADYGILVSPAKKREWNPELTDDDRFLASAILSVLNDPEKRQRMKEKARLRAEQFSYENYREKLIKILEQ